MENVNQAKYQEKTNRGEMKKSVVKLKQDQVNNANSAFIFMINLLIIQGCQSGSFSRGGHLVRLVW